MAVFQIVLIQEIHEHLHHINIKMNVMIVKYHLSFILFFIIGFYRFKCALYFEFSH